MAKKEKIVRQDPKTLNLSEQLVVLNRVAKVVKGGRRFSFNAMMIVGDKSEHLVGLGFGKANEVPEAIRKGVEKAKSRMFKVMVKKGSIPHEVIGKFGSTRVWMKPATEGTGIIAGGSVRAVLENAGVHDILTKVQGSRNPLNVVKATIDGLQNLMDADEIAKRRGKTLKEIWD